MIVEIEPFHDNDLLYPFAFWNPWKILANLGAIVLIAGSAKAIADRMGAKEESVASSSFDWIFVYLLLGVGVSGLLTEILRYAAEPTQLKGLVYTAYVVYFVHLVLVFDLLVYLPYSKFAHIVYRTVALVYAEHSGRNEGVTQKV